MQWKGKAVRANSSLQLASFMEDVYNAEGSPATQTPVVSLLPPALLPCRHPLYTCSLLKKWYGSM